jgi:PadR family transcriptional regulator PadR
MKYYLEEKMNIRDIGEINKDFQKGIYTGTSVLILLSVVGRAKEPIYGYQIAKIIEKDNADIPDGLLESKVDPSVNGPPRRYYRITELGTRTLEQLSATWQSTKNFIDSLIIGAEHDK